jgi:hypothetical protein
MSIPPERKAITIHGLDDARIAATAAFEVRTPVLLLSAEAAAASVGPAWFREILASVSEEIPNADVQGALDCADYAGHALAAIREGVGVIVYDGPAAAAVDAIATESGVIVLRERPPSLDLPQAELNGESREDACRAWLLDSD